MKGTSTPRTIARKPKSKVMERPKSRDFVTSFARGLEVIQSFNNAGKGISAVEIARRTGLSRAAIRRFLLTLETLGFAECLHGVYHLRPSVLRLACSYLGSTSLPTLAQPILEEVSQIVGESTSLAALDGDDIIYLARHTSSRVLSVGLSVGSRLPAYCTSMGRVLLADMTSQELSSYLNRIRIKKWTAKTVVTKTGLTAILQQVAQNGYCLVDGELEPGLRSIAVPIRNSSGKIVAAMNVGAHISSVTSEDLHDRILPVLSRYSDMLSRLL